MRESKEAINQDRPEGGGRGVTEPALESSRCPQVRKQKAKSKPEDQPFVDQEGEVHWRAAGPSSMRPSAFSVERGGVQAPSSKLQAPEKHQAAIPERSHLRKLFAPAFCGCSFAFGPWSFSGAWMLAVGASAVRTVPLKRVNGAFADR